MCEHASDAITGWNIWHLYLQIPPHHFNFEFSQSQNPRTALSSFRASRILFFLVNFAIFPRSLAVFFFRFSDLGALEKFLL